MLVAVGGFPTPPTIVLPGLPPWSTWTMSIDVAPVPTTWNVMLKSVPVPGTVQPPDETAEYRMTPAGISRFDLSTMILHPDGFPEGSNRPPDNGSIGCG